MIETAGHLPGLPATEVAWRTLDFSAWGERAQVRVPELTAKQAGALAGHVREQARSYLRTLPVSQIVATLDAAIARLLDRDDPCRRRAEAVLPIVTGYDRESVRLGLSGYLRSFRAPQLQRFLAEDFANPAVLDGFQPAMKGGFTRAHGPQLLLHIWAGNVPGLSLWSLISGLLVKAGTVGKVASAEPLLAGWFAQILAEIDPKLGECLAVVWWKGGDAEAERAWLREADTVIAYGGNDALTAIRERVPVTARFLPHGHRIGFGLIGAEALDTRRAGPLARLVAQDVARWEQQGCYSPQMLFVARGGAVSPREFALYSVADMLEEVTAIHAVSPSALEIEITEEAILDPALADAQLKWLEKAGYKLAVDDFGMGHSSLAYLISLKVDRLKIDRSFVKDVARSETNQKLITAMVSLGQSLGLDIVVEGVETAEDATVLARLGCTIAQGYLFARPMPPKALANWIAEHQLTTLKRKRKTGHLSMA